MPDPRRSLRALGDAELLALVAHIDTEAFAAVYDRYGEAAFSLARRIAGPSAAEEVVQAVFGDLWRSASSLDGGVPLRDHLLLAVRERCIEVLQRLPEEERRRIETAALDSEGAAPVSARAAAALDALPGEERLMLELAYFRGCTQTEVARRLELPIDAVKERTRLALERLRPSVDDTVGDPE